MIDIQKFVEVTPLPQGIVAPRRITDIVKDLADYVSLCKTIHSDNEVARQVEQEFNSYVAGKVKLTPGKSLAQALGFKPPHSPAQVKSTPAPAKKPVNVKQATTILKPSDMSVMIKNHPDPSVKRPIGLYKVHELEVMGDSVKIKIHGNRGWILNVHEPIPEFLNFYKSYRVAKQRKHLSSPWMVISNAA